MSSRRPDSANLYAFRDVDIMHRLAESNGAGIRSQELAEALGFPAEEGARPVGVRLAWMRRYGMVVYDDEQRSWGLSSSGQRVVRARLLAPELRAVEKMPDEKMVEVMALVTSRFQRGEPMVAHLLRREFAYGTRRRA